jgi:DNA ligase 1
MKTLSNIIKQLRSTNSRLEKLEILRKNKNVPELEMAMWMVQEPSINYFMKIDKKLPRNFYGTNPLDLRILNKIHDNIIMREMTGNAAKNYVEYILSTLNSEDADILMNIINRDLECNVGRGLISQIWPQLIKEMPCMLASKMDAKISAKITDKQDGYIIQKKCDGGRALAIVSESGAVSIFSRNGKELLTHNVFDSQLSNFPGCVFDGELLVTTETGVEDRQTGNGIFNKAVRQTISPSEAMRFSYILWDMIPAIDFFNGFCQTPYKERLTNLRCASSKFESSKISIVETKIVSNLSECMEFYDKMIEKKEEGAILKLADGPWENKRSKYMIKLKQELDIDAECVSWTPHAKNPNMIGSLVARTRDDKILFYVGSGLTDEDRLKHPSHFIGKIIQCKYNSIIKNKNDNVKSLFLPVFQCVRLDKNQANSEDELS